MLASFAARDTHQWHRLLRLMPPLALFAVGLLLGLATGSSEEPATAAEPRYVTFLRAPGAWGAITKDKPFGNQCPDNGCVTEWVPDSCTEQTFRSILTTLGLNGTENPHMKPAVKILFNINNISTAVLEKSIAQCLAMSAKTKVPIFVALQGQWWWWGSGLWNWFDPAQPGYDPANKANVERHSWAAGTELKVSWHDWATIVRQEPAQNIHAPKVKQFTVQNQQKLGGVVVKWWKALALEDKHLLAGVLVGREAGIGYNGW